MKKLVRPLGNITADMETYLFEMVQDHQMQKHEVFGIIGAWIDVHYPAAQEEYMDGTHPKLRGTEYGPVDNKKKKG